MRRQRVFYVVYSQDTDSQKALDAIRLLAEPGEKNRAHITVRGPYKQRHHFPVASRAVRGSPILIDGIGTFFGPKQNTVFMSCDSPGLRKAWYKPHLKDVHPHMTIYDGKDRAFAEALASALSRRTPDFTFPATDLKPMTPVKGQGDIELSSSYDSAFVKRVTGIDAPIDAVHNLSDETRIRTIGRLIEYLNERPTASGRRQGAASVGVA